MKKLLTLVCCIFATVLFAQTNILDKQLSDIDQSSVTSGIIYERVMKLSNFYNFNQSKEFETASADYFAQVLSEMHRASNGKEFISAEDFQQFEATQPQTNTADLAILSTQYHVMNYDVVDPQIGGLIFDEQTQKFVLIKDKTPFYMLHNTVIAPNKNYLVGENAVFNIDKSLYFTNGTKTIVSLKADFGDGAERTIIANSTLIPESITVRYDKSGEKKIKFSIVYSDETTLTTFAKFSFYLKQDFVNNQNSNCGEPEPKENGSIQANVADAFTGFNSGDFPIKGLINYRTFYSTANGNTSKTLRNPVILIDGFDPKNTRKIEDCDCAANPECLDKNKTNDIFDPIKHLSIVDAMGYYDTTIGNIASVMTDLRANGFDVIIVDQPSWEILHPTIPTKLQYNPRTWSFQTVPNMIKVDGGADYVERNAMALVALLKDVKAKVAANGSNSQTVIFGPSMGGLISRYALAYMEKKFAQTGDIDWKHNTKLWVSIDSPHLGANVPMGDQSLLNHVKGSSSEAKVFYDEKLRSPAAQEMLIEQHREYNGNYNVADPNFLNAQTSSQNMPQNRGNSVFQQHYINQSNNGVTNSNGFPNDLRKIALINGSLTGSRNTVNIIGQQTTPFANDGEAIINMRGFQRINIPITVGYGFLSYTFTITIRTLIGVLESYNMPASGNNGRLSRFKSGFSDVTTQAFNANSRGCMDNVPGGFFKAQELIADPALGQDPINEGNYNTSALLLHSISTALGGSYWDVHAYNPRHSFIPTFSSLAILNPNQNWNNPLNVNLACASNKQTPFDSYYGEANNSEHTSFNKGMVDYLMKELGNPSIGIPPTPQAPWFPLQPSVLEGSSAVCFNVNSVYTINNICQVPSSVLYNNQNGNPVNGWSVQGNISIVSSTAYSVTVKGTSNAQGSGKIIATFQNGQTLEKSVYLGSPKFPTSGYVTGPTSVNFNQTRTYTYSGSAPVGASNNYQWYINAPINDGGGPTCEWQILTGQGTPTITVKTGCIAATAAIDVRVTNNCGTDSRYMYVSISAAGTGGGGSDPCATTINTFPNPITSSTNLEVNLTTPPPCGIANAITSSANAPINNELKIYDFYGVLIYSINYSTNSMTLTNINLNPGNYILNVFTNKGEILRKILIVQ